MKFETRLYSPVPGTLQMKRVDENDKLTSSGTLTEMLNLVKEKKGFNVINFNGHVEARFNVEHDKTIKNQVFINNTAFRYIKDEPNAYDNTFYTIARNGSILGENSPEKSIIIGYLGNRDYLDSINKEDAKELQSFIFSSEKYDNKIENVYNEIYKNLKEDKYNLNELLDLTKSITLTAQKDYNQEYNKGKNTFSVSTINQVALNLLKDIENDPEIRNLIEKRNNPESQNLQKTSKKKLKL